MKTKCLFAPLLVFVIGMQHAAAQTAMLFTAIQSNNIKDVELLLDKGADPNAYDDDSDNVLVNAARYASLDCMKVLLQKKANPNLRNKFGQTPLMFCTQDIDKMKMLLHYGADVNAAARSGNTALLIACGAGGQAKQIKFLLDHGADPLAKRWGGETALMRIAQFGDTMSLNLLLHKGIDIDAHPWGNTAMMYAARSNNWACVLCLLNNGADPNILDGVNMSPLLWAAEWNNLEAVKVLLKKTKDINAIDSLGKMTPLMWATYNEHDNPQIIQEFINAGALINIKDKNGATALDWAMKKGNTASVEVLKKAGAQ